VGDVASAAMLNANVRDAVNFALNRPLFVGTVTVAQSIPASAYTAVLWNINQVDTYSGHSTTVNTSRYTAGLPGWYDVRARLGYAPLPAAGPRVGIYIAVNGTIDQSTEYVIYPPTSGYGNVATFAFRYLNVGDYVEVYAYQATAGALSTNQGDCRYEVEWAHV
jgi:hypothetical protein